MQYAFTLGREYKLSLAELISLFGYENMQFFNQEIAIFNLSQLDKKIINRLGGTIRIIEIISETEPKTFPTDVIEYIKNNTPKGKLNFALAAFGIKMPLSEIGMRMKKSLSHDFSVRFLNSKNENIHSAVFKREKLGRSETEFVILGVNSDTEGNDDKKIIKNEKFKTEKNSWNEFISANERKNLNSDEEIWNVSQNFQKFYLGKTIACQDIDAYSRRDTGKNRDMIVGMMPPKLVQMMINLSYEKTAIYDPFCGLGTTLIEAANMGIYNLFGSDISTEMVTSSRESLDNFVREEKIWQERIKTAWGLPDKDFDKIFSKIFALDATKIEKAFSEHNLPKDVTIISEGFLGKVMKKHEITQDAVFSERRNITRLYDAFFSELKKAHFKGKIVMSFPFWKVHNVYIYMDELAEIIEKNGFKIENLLPRELDLNTKNGSLLYRRESQNVGREIIKIVTK